jgi:glycosyltransferase involved in cell wall biosynthesis
MKVSVIVPVGNGERFIEAALESIFFQGDTFPGLELEVIVVDNGSTDSTVDLIRRRFGSSVIMGQEPRRGAAFARNRGIGLATSPWLAFLDADDLWLPGKLRDQCAAFAAMPGLGMVFCQGEEFSDPPGTFPAVETARGFNHASALLVRREVFEKLGGFPDIALMEDIALSRALKRLGRPLCLRAKVRTSGRRWDQNGALRTILLMWRLRLAFALGAKPDDLARRYGYAPRNSGP